jgi:hypothetical protein
MVEETGVKNSKPKPRTRSLKHEHGIHHPPTLVPGRLCSALLISYTLHDRPCPLLHATRYVTPALLFLTSTRYPTPTLLVLTCYTLLHTQAGRFVAAYLCGLPIESVSNVNVLDQSLMEVLIFSRKSGNIDIEQLRKALRCIARARTHTHTPYTCTRPAASIYGRALCHSYTETRMRAVDALSLSLSPSLPPSLSPSLSRDWHLAGKSRTLMDFWSWASPSPK